MIDVYEELLQIIDILNREQIKYALCGGLAYSFYAEPRATVDIDLVVQKKDFDKIQKALLPLAYEKLSDRMTLEREEVEIDRLVKLHPGEEYVFMADFIFADSFPGNDIWKGLNKISWRGSDLCLVSVEQLIKLKKIRNSDQDKVDISNLMKILEAKK